MWAVGRSGGRAGVGAVCPCGVSVRVTMCFRFCPSVSEVCLCAWVCARVSACVRVCASVSVAGFLPLFITRVFISVRVLAYVRARMSVSLSPCVCVFVPMSVSCVCVSVTILRVSACLSFCVLVSARGPGLSVRLRGSLRLCVRTREEQAVLQEPTVHSLALAKFKTARQRQCFKRSWAMSKNISIPMVCACITCACVCVQASKFVSAPRACESCPNCRSFLEAAGASVATRCFLGSHRSLARR